LFAHRIAGGAHGFEDIVGDALASDIASAATTGTLIMMSGIASTAMPLRHAAIGRLFRPSRKALTGCFTARIPEP
jgi:hypothetical protein